MSNTIVITVNTTWNLINFRSGLIRGLLASGYKVVALAPDDRYAYRVQKLGCEVIHLPMDNHGTNPVHDLALMWRYFRLLRAIRPKAMLGFTIKPNIYGSIAAHMLGIPVVNNIAGLGTTFLKSGWLNQVARFLYKLALSRSWRVFFQNSDDANLFITSGLVKKEKTAILPGSGVNTIYFAPQKSAEQAGRAIRFLLVARLLWDKGVGEYIQAARLLHDECVNVDVRILGFLDVNNPSAISRDQLDLWQSEGLVTYQGESDDVRSFLADVDCVVLPSYYPEGTPRSLLEAASMGKPIITTDAPGCRDMVLEGETGFLVPVKDAEALAVAMKNIADLSAKERAHMGAASRNFVLANYDERIVVDAYLTVIRDI